MTEPVHWNWMSPDTKATKTVHGADCTAIGVPPTTRAAGDALPAETTPIRATSAAHPISRLNTLSP